MEGDTLKGHLEMLILATLEARPLHGYAVIEALHRVSDEAFDLPEGTVYPALHRLEREGLLASNWTTEGRRRRVYRLTRSGKKALSDQKTDWRAFSRAVQSVLGAKG